MCHDAVASVFVLLGHAEPCTLEDLFVYEFVFKILCCCCFGFVFKIFVLLLLLWVCLQNSVVITKGKIRKK